MAGLGSGPVVPESTQLDETGGLGADTHVGVMNTILRPPDYLTQVVGSGCKAIISARKWRKSSHLVVLPNEPEVDIADVVRRTVESRATPSLPERLRIGGLRNTHDDALRYSSRSM